MEKLQQQWWRAVKSHLSYKNATILVCLFNIITALLFLRGFFCSSSKFATSHKALYVHVKESEDIRRAMVPLDLIRRVREIRQDVNVETEQIQQKDVKQTAAVDLISRLNNFRSNSDTGSIRGMFDQLRVCLEEIGMKIAPPNKIIIKEVKNII
ncbi:hypothetical protein ACS0TY_026577 [Phlomoides rotata]